MAEPTRQNRDQETAEHQNRGAKNRKPDQQSGFTEDEKQRQAGHRKNPQANERRGKQNEESNTEDEAGFDAGEEERDQERPNR